MERSQSNSIFPNNIVDMSAEGESQVAPLGIKARLIIDEVEVELRGALAAYPPMRSYHEGYAILKEELDELWDEVRLKPARRDPWAMRKEATQIAAMAIRFILDTIPDLEA